MKKKKIEKMKECRHDWAMLLAQKGKKIIPVSVARVCLKCGELKLGFRSLKISRFRVAIEDGTLLRIPVGTNLYK